MSNRIVARYHKLEVSVELSMGLGLQVNQTFDELLDARFLAIDLLWIEFDFVFFNLKLSNKFSVTFLNPRHVLIKL
ncbi:hypothetical protein IEQ34_000847 [Dendrobium chrysotoxum]|uniref:Uncharacterized protein n=1 Tax=Dendrobium chrysotoxum TaxID=161865 RepID=A0AAV7HTI7_DENCH|nr:hypothetical protein IEQ34_000847 [Dendrobium chrysotoxum]